MKKYILLSFSILCSSCLILRMRSPKVIGRILDYENNPIANCQVGNSFTDDKGYFSIPEERYLSFEILPFEAPPAGVNEIIKKEGYEPDTIMMYNPFGGAAQKGTTWDTKDIYLKRINEKLNIPKLILNNQWKTIYTNNDKELVGILVFHNNYRSITRKIKSKEYLFEQKKQEEYPTIKNFSPFVKIEFKKDSVFITDETEKYVRKDSICSGKYYFLSDNVIQLETNHPKIKGKYIFEEFDKVFFRVKEE
ncbi:MAG: carboxypeptidase regulatory-like domain-containing protein [Capnocytophaga sp.]|nr:carboxypeptidase regulatory-like domain-containing protein [Capnocytophaga sp.]